MFKWLSRMFQQSPATGSPFGVYPGTLPSVLQPTDFTYVGYYDVQPYGNDSLWSQGLTHRYVGGELRFINLNLHGMLQEWKIGATPMGGKINTTTGSWSIANLPGTTTFKGLWYDAPNQRLWVTSGPDYTNVNVPSNIVTCTLDAGGVLGNIHRVSLANIPGKRVYGGACEVPQEVADILGGNKYLVGFGGYTSLVDQGGGASMGPTAYAIPDPAVYANNGIMPARTVLDAKAANTRGIRTYTQGTWPQGSPINYFDSGDARQNPSTRPTVPPLSTAGWLSPNVNGKGWMTWGDSYYNTGMFIRRNGKWAFVLVGSFVKGFGWYQTSTLAFDGREFELHLFDPARFNDGPATRPYSTTKLQLPMANGARVWGGNTPTGNIAGATYDETTGRLYMLGMDHAGSDTNRLYVYQVN